MAETSQAMHATATKDLLTSRKYSDLTIICGADVHRVHKAIVCARCGFFERAERFGKEAAENIVDLPADSPRTIALLIQFLYTGEYDPVLIAVPSKTERLTLQLPEPWKHVWPHTYARHCTQRLYTHYTCGTGCWFDCKNMVCEVHCPPIATVPPYSRDEGPEQLLVHSKIYEIGDKYDVPGLKEPARDKFSQAAQHAYTTTPDEDTGLRVCIQKTLTARKDMIRKRDIRAFLETQLVLMYNILLHATA